MNIDLTEQIIKHIFYNFGIIENENFNCKSLTDNEFILQEKLKFESDSHQISNNIWGCQLLIQNQEFKILLGDTSQDENIKEYCAILHLNKMPAYGLYLINDPSYKDYSLISVSIDEKSWLDCNTFIQATMLAAMEQILESGFVLQKCTKYNAEYKLLLSFIKHHTRLHEGQEDR